MNETKQFLVILESGPNGFGAYSPDVPGCFAVGRNEQETIQRFREALVDHLELLALDGEELPEPATRSTMVDVRYPMSA